jgi:CheY-like chemotaxis protein/HPt (histidine-containing phosphotransfer) domain-containing protein
LPLERGLGINLQQPEHSQAQFKSNAHILLVEDNLINQIVAQELLESVGMTIDVANNGQEAINKVKTTRYDLILMDMQMPVLDGISATRIIRTLDNGHHLPIIAMTANVFTDDRLRCLDAGMNAHIAKPVDPSILYSTLAQWIPETAITDDSTSPSLDTTANLAIDSEINFPMIFSSPLLDMPTGLVYFGGNQQAYFKMLAQFISLHQHDIETINTLLEQNNVQDAERLAHTLKGISATLGANTLKELSFSIETALRHADNTENLADLLTEAHQELTTLCQFITDLNIAPPQPIAHKLSPENFKIQLTKLIMLLEDDDLESAYILESLLPLLKEKITQEHADLLLEQMNNYDFENALNNLQALIKLHPEWR